jgi:thioesterase domain-containing protein
LLVADELADRLGRRVSPALLFEHSSVRELARILESAADACAAPILLSESDEQPALFMLLGVHLYRELAVELEGHYSVYGVYAASELALLDQVGHACTVEELAGEYVALIRAQQPHGPYRIGGMSFGGVVAYEVAQQLERQGQPVEQLLLLDALLPQSRWQRARRLLTTPALDALDLLGQRTLARLAPAPRGRTASTLGMLHDDSKLQSLEDLRQEAYRSAATKYAREAEAYAGDVTLIVAGARLARDPLLDPGCGFADLVENLTVHTLPVDHLALLEQPAVAEVAECALGNMRRLGRRSCVVPMRTSVLTSV